MYVITNPVGFATPFLHRRFFIFMTLYATPITSYCYCYIVYKAPTPYAPHKAISMNYCIFSMLDSRDGISLASLCMLTFAFIHFIASGLKTRRLDIFAILVKALSLSTICYAKWIVKWKGAWGKGCHFKRQILMDNARFNWEVSAKLSLQKDW